MKISNEAVEAATRARFEWRGESYWEDWVSEAKAEALDDMRAALEAAAPFIRAEALEDAADWLDPDASQAGVISAWLHDRAKAELRQP